MTLLAFWPNRRWWLPGRWGHVTVLDRHEETWVQIDVDRTGINVVPFWRAEDVADRLSNLTAHCEILSYDGGGARCFGATMTCVTFARHYTGVPSRALLPDGLMRDLLRNGAEVIHGRRRDATRDERAEAEPASG